MESRLLINYWNYSGAIVVFSKREGMRKRERGRTKFRFNYIRKFRAA